MFTHFFFIRFQIMFSKIYLSARRTLELNVYAYNSDDILIIVVVNFIDSYSYLYGNSYRNIHV